MTADGTDPRHLSDKQDTASMADLVRSSRAVCDEERIECKAILTTCDVTAFV